MSSHKPLKAAGKGACGLQLGMGIADGCSLPEVAEALPALGGMATVGSRLHRFKRTVSAFKGADWIECAAVAQWDYGQEEPWLLLTNLPGAEAGWYAFRLYEECAFRGFKSLGFQWQKSRVRDPERAGRL